MSLLPTGDLVSRLVHAEGEELFGVGIEREEFSRGDHEEPAV